MKTPDQQTWEQACERVGMGEVHCNDNHSGGEKHKNGERCVISCPPLGDPAATLAMLVFCEEKCSPDEWADLGDSIHLCGVEPALAAAVCALKESQS